MDVIFASLFKKIKTFHADGLQAGFHIHGVCPSIPWDRDRPYRTSCASSSSPLPPGDLFRVHAVESALSEIPVRSQQGKNFMRVEFALPMVRGNRSKMR
jgi:hypothetical protein